jgi:hypothetical protein
VDLDADGNADLVVGCFEGLVYVLAGEGGGAYGEAKRLQDSAGNDVHFGEFWDYEIKKWGADKVDGQGNLCVYPDLVDWDGDGDLDLLFGGYQGTVGVRINEGSAAEPKFATGTTMVKVGNDLLKVNGAASASFVDWDGDGMSDLVIGSSKGEISWFKNTGAESAPAFAKGQMIANKSDGTPASYLRLNAEDFDGDGDLDLLVGAYDSTDYNARSAGIWFYERK